MPIRFNPPKKPFKPNNGFTGNPTPALSPQAAFGKSNYKYRPGAGAPDPVPARPASATYDIQGIKLVSVDEDGNFNQGPDPVPTETYREE